jgi:hypothetical protein
MRDNESPEELLQRTVMMHLTTGKSYATRKSAAEPEFSIPDF